MIELAKKSRVHTTDVLETLQQAMDAMVDQETGARGYLIAGDERFLEPYYKGSNRKADTHVHRSAAYPLWAWETTGVPAGILPSGSA